MMQTPSGLTWIGTNNPGCARPSLTLGWMISRLGGATSRRPEARSASPSNIAFFAVYADHFRGRISNHSASLDSAINHIADSAGMIHLPPSSKEGTPLPP